MRIDGTLKSWNDDRGFGFIEPSLGGQEIFVHIKAFETRFGRPQIGQRLTFEEAAFSLILHTGQQDLGRHVHLHALVAGGALTQGGEWQAPTRGFLFSVKALSKMFRGNHDYSHRRRPGYCYGPSCP